MPRPRLAALAVTYLVVALPWSLLAQAKPTLKPSDYGQWESLDGASLSPDGRWLAYGIQRVDEASELRVRSLARDTTRTTAWGSDPRFSADSRWLVWAVGVSPDEKKRLEKDKKPVRLGAGLLELESGAERTFETVAQAAFDASGAFLALHGYPPDEPKGKGGDLRVRNLVQGTEVTFGNVAEFAWSDTASLLALALATGADAGNGVQVYDARSGRLQSLDASGSAYHQLAWREDHPDLAVLRSVAPASDSGSAHHLLAWRGLGGEAAEQLELDPAAAGIGDTLEIGGHLRPRWSDDGTRLALGLRPVSRDSGARADSAAADSSAAKDDEDELPGLEIWHTKDVRVVPQQKAAASRDSSRTLLAVWEPARQRMIQVGTDLLGSSALLEGWRFAIESVSAPYPWGAMFGRPYHDVWVVDLETGERSLALERVRRSWESPGGRYLLSFDGKDYWTHDLRSGRRVNVTQNLPTPFADTAYDTPTDQLPPHGVGGWYEGDSAVLLYDEFDVWRVAPDGSGGERLTQGAEDDVIHRVVRLDREADAFDPSAPLYLSLRGEWSEQRGYARIRAGGEVEGLVLRDQLISGLTKADSSDVFLFTAQAFDDSPDLFVAGPDLSSPRQVTETNPFQSRFAWSRAELIAYQSEAGRRLQGALLYPANHDAGRRYPMIVYTYELLSPRIHAYEVPSERDYYNFTAWTQQGYFVLLPDIVYRARDPGISALEAVRPAVAHVVEMGLVDPQRVGLIGHSWGGYQATFLPTRTDIFAASVAGAPLTDFVSFMGALHWNPGIPEVDHWETGQARMEVPYWEDPEAHHRNSPIHKVQDLNTPLLMAFGNEDGVVDWDQGTEFYNFARRAGKQMVLLVYDGEDHGFRHQANQVDYHRRILEWFGHYLKGEPAPAWITEGIPAEEIEQEARRVAAQGKSSRP